MLWMTGPSPLPPSGQKFILHVAFYHFESWYRTMPWPGLCMWSFMSWSFVPTVDIYRTHILHVTCGILFYISI